MIEPCIRTDYATTLKNAIRRADTAGGQEVGFEVGGPQWPPAG
jgi:hypothetical protein